LGEMTRRKREITGLANEQDFPHLVELAVPPEGFRGTFLEFDAFHRERRIPVRRGRSRHEVKQYIRFCFPDAATADAFRNRFGGECLTHALAKPKRRTSATSSDAPGVTREAEEDWGKVAKIFQEPLARLSDQLRQLLRDSGRFYLLKRKRTRHQEAARLFARAS